jgi:opacity protein-like surface antigen
MKTRIIIALVSAAFCSSAAIAAQSASDAAKPPEAGTSAITLDPGSATAAVSKNRNSKDPKEIICKRSNDHSSRLDRKKVCMTRAQYEERRMLDRDMIERGQASRPTY